MAMLTFVQRIYIDWDWGAMSKEGGRFDEDRFSSIQLSEEGLSLSKCPTEPIETMKSRQALQDFEVKIAEDISGVSQQDFNDLLALVETMAMSPSVGSELRAWLKGWMNAPVPALGRVTPADALKLPGGRERVEQALRCMGSGAFL